MTETDFMPVSTFLRSSGSSLSLFRNFVIVMIVEIVLSSCETSNIDIRSDSKLPNLEFVDIPLPSKDPG